MTVKELVEKLGLIEYTSANDRSISAVYSCDLLSNALVKLKKDDLWLTVISNVNVAAVAYNNNVSCVILTEGIKPDRQLLERAVEYKISLLGTEHDSYQTAVLIAENIYLS